MNWFSNDINSKKLDVKEFKNEPNTAKNTNKVTKKVIQICSGKGGVGKSTIASIMALYASHTGSKVALLDADIYGPSIPTLFKATNYKPDVIDGKSIPYKINNLEIMSMGMVIPEKSGVIWRGPMLSKALKHMMQNTNWSDDIEYMIIDTPPGTGDIHITLANDYGLRDYVLVSTPSEVSISDVIRAKDAMQNLGAINIALVVNMSFIEYSGKQRNIFGKVSAEDCAERIGVGKFIQIPLLEKVANFDIDEILRDDTLLGGIKTLFGLFV